MIFPWSIARYGYVMTAAFLVNGLLVVVFALGLGQTLPGTTASRAAATLLLLAGFAMLGLAFTTDASIRRTPATWHGIIHDLSFAGVGLTLFPSMLAFGWGISPIFGLARAEHVYLADGSAGSSNLCAKRGSVLRVSRGSARVDRESCVETEKDGGPVPEQAQLPSPIGDVWISPSARRIRLRFRWTARSRQRGTARDRDIVFRPVTEMPQAAQFCCFFLKKAVSCSGSVPNVMPCRAAILSQILAS